jgi:hypothetical protein
LDESELRLTMPKSLFYMFLESENSGEVIKNLQLWRWPINIEILKVVVFGQSSHFFCVGVSVVWDNCYFFVSRPFECTIPA